MIKRFVGPGARFSWDGRLASGNAAPNGIFFATATASGRRTTIRFSLLR